MGVTYYTTYEIITVIEIYVNWNNYFFTNKKQVAIFLQYTGWQKKEIFIFNYFLKKNSTMN